MDRQRQTLVISGRRVLAMGVVVAGLVLGGCADRTTYVAAGRTGLEARYDGVDVEVDLPANVPVPSVVAAGEQVLLRRGHTITASQATGQRGRVVGRPGSRRLHRKVEVDARQIPGATRVWVKVQPGGDEAASRSILEDMLIRMGF